eukprot:gnl/TRDRNA2_/TRDRNA2_163630_c9_seq1.p1 gnl/TRDRNA2_/TRDRNA2_163630_c9~~gnl/TRDRNA2_/TRDRNA2_163630_c9_seq1.p1  ORF type:complete len:134 (-),score=23.32 gnl/TRDRNA2_/TRDRNA2_163630_c9_seq1:80-442(-)
MLFDMKVTPRCFGAMSALLRDWCLGVATPGGGLMCSSPVPMCLALEGGYTQVLPDCVEASVRALRGEPPKGIAPDVEEPKDSTWEMLQRVKAAHIGRWQWARRPSSPWAGAAMELKAHGY